MRSKFILSLRIKIAPLQYFNVMCHFKMSLQFDSDFCMLAVRSSIFLCETRICTTQKCHEVRRCKRARAPFRAKVKISQLQTTFLFTWMCSETGKHFLNIYPLVVVRRRRFRRPNDQQSHGSHADWIARIHECIETCSLLIPSNK